VENPPFLGVKSPKPFSARLSEAIGKSCAKSRSGRGQNLGIQPMNDGYWGNVYHQNIWIIISTRYHGISMKYKHGKLTFKHYYHLHEIASKWDIRTYLIYLDFIKGNDKLRDPGSSKLRETHDKHI
jgi:hypothetical protein